MYTVLAKNIRAGGLGQGQVGSLGGGASASAGVQVFASGEDSSDEDSDGDSGASVTSYFGEEA